MNLNETNDKNDNTVNPHENLEAKYKDYSCRDKDINMQSKYQYFLKFINNKNLSILNVGCGSGEFTKILALKGHSVDAIDVDDVAINISKQKCEGLNINLFKVGILEFNPSKKYDIIV